MSLVVASLASLEPAAHLDTRDSREPLVNQATQVLVDTQVSREPLEYPATPDQTETQATQASAVILAHLVLVFQATQV